MSETPRTDALAGQLEHLGPGGRSLYEGLLWNLARQLERELAQAKTTMVAAAEEIAEHWDAHCDEEGYGPANLMRRLEEGIPSQYGYTAGAFAQLRADAERYRWLQEHTVATGLSRWMGGHQFLSDAIDAIRAIPNSGTNVPKEG